ncbi:MAG: G8 domain-containing protein [Cyclobacteriaceae bacterium]
MKKPAIFPVVILWFQVLNLSAQQTISVNLNDTLTLDIGTYRGELQWESSSNKTDWMDIDGAISNPYKYTVDQLPIQLRARVIEEPCEEVYYSEIIEVVQAEIVEEEPAVSNLKPWSDPLTWPNGKPQEGDEVIIGEGDSILLDEYPPALGGLTIDGLLLFDTLDLDLTSEWIVVRGELRIGTEDKPYTKQATITLTDTDTEASFTGMGTRGIMVMGGALELHGAVPEKIWTRLDAHAEEGAISLQLVDDVDWKGGEQILVAPTDYYEAGLANQSITQKVALTSVDGKNVTIDKGLNAQRWGLLQYPTANGMSLDPAGVVAPPVANSEVSNTPTVLDERAEVAHITRNIVIQAPDDEVWNNEGFGAHTMIMPGSTAHVEGVHFRRVGQRGRIRRYPWHWHMLSYSGTETLADAEGHYFKKNVIDGSENRGIVIHGTNGVLVQDNIVHDVKGHGVFTEDAVERRNTIDGNLVFHVRNPEWGDQIREHEVGSFGSSGFWIANPDNTVTNNIAADCQTFGFWLAFPDRPFGSANQVLYDDGQLMRPNRMLFGAFDSNTAHSNKNDGIHLDDPQVDEAGNTQPLQYWSTADGRTDGTPYDALRRFTLSRFKVWKNMDNGSWDRGVWTDIVEVVSADNCGRFFAGSGADGVIERSLVVGTSLNFMMNGTGRPEIADFQFNPSSAPTAFATYHSAFSMRQNIVVNFEVTEYDRAGVFATDDYYIRPVDKGLVRNYENLIIESHPGVKLKPQYDYMTFASALWDPYGFWGPEENYLVYNDEFLTHGKEITTPELGAEIVGGVSVQGPFYGFVSFVLHGTGPNPPQNFNFMDLMALHVDRYDADDLENPVATWEVAEAERNWTLQHMRDFATTPDGIYELTFPNQDNPTDFHVEVESMIEATDTQVIGIQFDGSVDATVYLQQPSNQNNFHVYEELNSLQDVMNSSGETFWQDTANNRVWVKILGGRWEAAPADVGDWTEETNETMNLRIREANN